MSARAVAALAVADLRERMRRYAFLVTLGATAALAWSVYRGSWAMRLGNYEGVPNSAWIGTLVAMATTTFLTLFGFYVVKGSVGRDRQTGVGEILATTPMSRLAYVFGKGISHFLVLGAMVGILGIGAAAMALGRGSFDALPLFQPLLVLSLPAMALVAALAVLFETIPGLGGAFGNVVYFVVWATVLSFPVASEAKATDVIGFLQVRDSLAAAARAEHPDATPEALTGMSLTIADSRSEATIPFTWPGLGWSAEELGQRLLWFLVACGIVAVAAVPFDRFDPSRKRVRLRKARAEEAPATAAAAAPIEEHVALTPLPGAARRGRFTGRVRGELALLLGGRRWWWWLGAAGLGVAQVTAAAEVVHGQLVPVAWVWGVALFSALGCRDRVHGTGELVFSSPRPIARQAFAAWAAGVAVAVLLAGPALVRFALAGNQTGAGGILLGAAFVPALALAIGTWAGTPKPFEAMLVVLVYLGPLNRVPMFDFVGGTSEAWRGGAVAAYGVAAAALVAAAVAGRRWGPRR